MAARIRHITPAEVLAEAMTCQGCGKAQSWDLGYHGSQACAGCGRVRRYGKSATPAVRLAVAERDGWMCHRCGLPVDPDVVWPHPLCGVADHYPFTRRQGGPTITQNLKLAHSCCNGSSGHGPQESERYVLSDADKEIIEKIRGRVR
jgi:hypothetical protein